MSPTKYWCTSFISQQITSDHISITSGHSHVGFDLLLQLVGKIQPYSLSNVDMVNHIVVENKKGDLPYGALEEKITL